MVKKEKSLALDNEDLRTLNTKTVVEAFEKVGNSMEEMRKNAKVSKIYLVVMVGVILFLVVGGMIVVAMKSGGVSNFVENFWITDNINTRIICYDDLKNMSFRNTGQAHYFIEVFGNESYCEINNIKDETH